MDDFCWIVGPGLCGRLSFDLPIVELTAMVLVSGFVTWATIFFSVRQAKKETDRSLKQAREEADRAIRVATERDLRAAIVTLSSEASTDFKAGSYGSLRSPSAIAGLVLIRTCGLPFAGDVAEWVTEFTQYACNLKNKRIVEETRGIPNILAITGPAETLIEALSKWVSNPELEGEQFAERTSKFKDANKKVTDKVLADFMEKVRNHSKQKSESVRRASH